MFSFLGGITVLVLQLLNFLLITFGSGIGWLRLQGRILFSFMLCYFFDLFLLPFCILSSGEDLEKGLLINMLEEVT